MNFLTNFYFSRNSDERILAGFISNTVNLSKCRPSRFLNNEGFNFHKKLSSYSRMHEIHKRSERRFKYVSQKFTPITIDLIYDHFLAKNWNNYSNSELNSFEERVKLVIQNNKKNLPHASKIIYTSLLRQHQFSSLKTMAGIHLYIYQSRIYYSWPIQLTAVFEQLSDSYSELESDFNEFFIDLNKFVISYDNYLVV